MSTFARFLLPLLLLLLTACGGGGGGPAPVPTPPTVPTVPVPPGAQDDKTTITLQSDAGDIIGQGKTYTYDKATARIGLKAEKNRLVVRVMGDKPWVGVFLTGGVDQTELKVGMVANAVRFEDDGDWTRPSHAWYGEGGWCDTSTGWFAIDSVRYSGAVVTQITLRFERHCNGAGPALRGQIRYFASDTTAPPPPVLPAPATLWRPPADLPPAVGNSAYFESDAEDYLGLGQRYQYDRRSAAVKVTGSSNELHIQVAGSEHWSGSLRGMGEDVEQFAPGYYPGVRDVLFANPVKGGMSWTADGRGCQVSNGWFVVDAITFVQGRLVSLDLRFEQHCEGRAAALRGAIHWSDPALVTLPPLAGNTAVGSWRAPAAALPSSGNYLYMQSDPGEVLAKGLVDLQTSANAAIKVTVEADDSLRVEGQGVHLWRAYLVPPLGQGRFAPGSYPAMAGYPYATAAAGALSVTGDYVPTEPKGWLVIDSIAYADGKLVALDARFEQLGTKGLGNDAGLLHGQVHWRAEQASVFPGPTAVPAGFWRPAPGTTPSLGNYVYMESELDDFVGQGGVYLFTPLDSLMSVTGEGNGARVFVRGDQQWHGDMVGIAGMGHLQPGYYRGMTNSPTANPLRGQFDWSGDGRGCNEVTSGVVIDKVAYEGDRLTELNLRFEQHCGNGAMALRGEVHWSASDLRMPQGPAAIPATLWRAPAAALPASGNYLYVDSQPGGPIGVGKVGLMTAQDTVFFARTSTPIRPEAYFNLNADSPAMGDWHLDLQAMVGLQQFQVGFYDRAMRFPFHNGAFGGLTWTYSGASCDKSLGWFAIDKANYVNGTLTALHARFNVYYCDIYPQYSRGEFNWEAAPGAQMAARLKGLGTPGKTGAGPLQEGPMRARRIR